MSLHVLHYMTRRHLDWWPRVTHGVCRLVWLTVTTAFTPRLSYTPPLPGRALAQLTPKAVCKG